MVRSPRWLIPAVLTGVLAVAALTVPAGAVPPGTAGADGSSTAAPSSSAGGTASDGRRLAKAQAAAASQTAAIDPADVITFDEVADGTAVTDQYKDAGVIFTSSVSTVDDGASSTNPVLSGDPTFEGPISGRFVIPGTTNPTTVLGFSLDVGYINSRFSTQVDYYDTAGHLAGSVVAQSEGFNHLTIDYAGVASFTVRAVSDEPAGFEIDNLSIQRSAQGTTVHRMVSLGDSYSSGEGLLPGGGAHYDCGTDLPENEYYRGTTAVYPLGWYPGDCQTASGSTARPSDVYTRPVDVYDNHCHRSGTAYPNLIRSQLGIAAGNALFAACSGATTLDILDGAQYPQSPPGVAGGQSQMKTAADFAAHGKPDLVTIGIGGNDAGFADIIKKCLVGSCVGDSTFAQGVIDKINSTVFLDIKATFLKLRAAYPRPATIAAFGYPDPIGDPNTDCGSFHFLYSTLNINADERAWLKDTVLPTLNSAVADAAAEAGITYIDVSNVLAGHTICSANPWINGLRAGAGDGTSPVAAESFHPNQQGHAAIAAYFMSHYVIGKQLTFADPATAVTIRPDTGEPIYIGTLDATTSQGCGTGCVTPVPCVQSCPITIQGSGYEPESTLTVTLHSAPRVLGTVHADGNGNVRGTFTIPRGTDYGPHSIELTGNDSSGNPQYGLALTEVLAKAPVKAVSLTLSGAHIQRLIKRRLRIECTMTAPAKCTVTITVKIGHHKYRAKSTVRPARGGYVTVKPQFTRKATAAIKKALRHHKKAKVKVIGVADSGQSRATATTAVKLRR